MTIAEAITFSELYNNTIYIPKAVMSKTDFDRLKLIAWAEINSITHQKIENNALATFSDFEKNMVKGFLIAYTEGLFNHEDDIMTRIGVAGSESLGDYSKGAVKLDKNMNKNDIKTYPFYTFALSFISRTNYINASIGGNCNIPSINKIGNF